MRSASTWRELWDAKGREAADNRDALEWCGFPEVPITVFEEF